MKTVRTIEREITMKRKSFPIVFTMFIMSVCMTGSCSEYVEYVPAQLVVERGDHKFRTNPSLLTQDHIEQYFGHFLTILTSHFSDLQPSSDGFFFLSARKLS
jgi:hypothetical protein